MSANNANLFRRCRNCMIPSNIVLFIIAPSCLRYSMTMPEMTLFSHLMTVSFMSYMGVLKLYSTLSHPRNMGLIRTRSKLSKWPFNLTNVRHREEIGVLTSLPLLRNVVADLEAARTNGESSLTLYFTKESHIHTLVNLVLLSGLPIANRRIPELDYAVRMYV